MELMRSPHTHPLSFRNKFTRPYGPFINREFLLGRDPFRGDFNKPPVNMLMNEGYFEIQLALPSYSKEEISVLVDGDMLTVKGEKKEKVKEDSDYILQEYATDSFEHTFMLKPYTNRNKIEATLKDGMLYIKLHHQAKKSNNTRSKIVKVL